MRICVLVASDLRLVRDWLTRELSTGADITIAGAACDRADALALAIRLQPHVVLVDRGMSDSLVAVREIIAHLPRLRVLAFGVHETEPEVAVCSEWGVHGFVPRDATTSTLLECVRLTMHGEFVGSPRVSALLLRHVARRSAPMAGSGLTARELDVVRLLELGRSNKEIAAAIGIEVATVKNHVHRLLRKLQAGRRSEAAAKWRRHGPVGTNGWVPRSAG